MSEPPADNLSWSTIARASEGEAKARSAFSRTYLPVVRGFLEARWRNTPLAAEIDFGVSLLLTDDNAVGENEEALIFSIGKTFDL